MKTLSLVKTLHEMVLKFFVLRGHESLSIKKNISVNNYRSKLSAERLLVIIDQTLRGTVVMACRQRFVFAAGGLWTPSFSPVTNGCKDNKMFNLHITPPDANMVLCTWAVSVRMVVNKMCLIHLQKFYKETSLSPLLRTKLSCENTYARW
jgi:hypothetical protein